MINIKAADPVRLLQIIYSKKLATQAGLADEMRLSRSFVNSVVQGLKADGLLREVGAEESRCGRRRVLLEINPDLAHFIGIDIGTTNLRVVLTDFLGRTLLTKRSLSNLSEGKDQVLQRIHCEIRGLREQDPHVKAIGMAPSGIINHVTGELLSWPKVPGWRNMPLKQIIEDEHHLPAIIDDSSRAMAVAEQHFGLGKGIDDFIHVAMGMGIGAAIYTNGRLHYGSDGFAGELGHITIDENGEICSCGNRGCLEVCASGWAIIAQARMRLQKGVESIILQMIQGDFERISVEIIVQAAQEGDRLASMILKEAAEHLGTALAGVVNLLNPKKLILGGAVSRVAGNYMMEPLMATIKERGLRQATQNLEVAISSLSDDAAAIGAAILAADQLALTDASFFELIKEATEPLPQNSPDVPAEKPRNSFRGRNNAHAESLVGSASD